MRGSRKVTVLNKWQTSEILAGKTSIYEGRYMDVFLDKAAQGMNKKRTEYISPASWSGYRARRRSGALAIQHKTVIPATQRLEPGLDMVKAVTILPLRIIKVWPCWRTWRFIGRRGRQVSISIEL